MTFVAKDPHQYVGRVVDNGQCVRFCQIAAGAGNTSTWRKGARVHDSAVLRGTVIATFNERGRYANATDGSSHAAIYLAETERGLLVLDQWVGRTVAERVISFRACKGPAVNDGDRYHVVEIE